MMCKYCVGTTGSIFKRRVESEPLLGVDGMRLFFGSMFMRYASLVEYAAVEQGGICIGSCASSCAPLALSVLEELDTDDVVFVFRVFGVAVVVFDAVSGVELLLVFVWR